VAIIEFDRNRTSGQHSRKESVSKCRSPVKAVQLPEHPDVRVFIYRSCRFVNLCAPPNGLVMIVPNR